MPKQGYGLARKGHGNAVIERVRFLPPFLYYYEMITNESGFVLDR